MKEKQSSLRMNRIRLGTNVLFNLLFDILQTVSDPRLRKED